MKQRLHLSLDAAVGSGERKPDADPKHEAISLRSGGARSKQYETSVPLNWTVNLPCVPKPESGPESAA